MPESSALIALRVFTGPHMGAEIMLAPGSYSFGSDPACDVVLNDSSVAAHHASITITRGAETTVHIRPQEASVLVNNTPVSQEGALQPAGLPWCMGLTCLAWNEPGHEQPTVITQLPLGNTANSTPAPSQVPASDSPAQPVLTAAAQPSPSTNAQLVPSLLHNRHWIRRFALAALCVLLGLLALQWHGTKDSNAPLIAALHKNITAAGFPSLQVSSEGNALAITGYVTDNQQWDTVMRLAQGVDCPVHMRVAVLEELVKNMSLQLRAHGVTAQITLPEQGNNMTLAAYIHDAPTEQKVFAALEDALPQLPPMTRHIIHTDQLEASIRHELEQQHIQDAQLRFAAGQVEISATSDPGEQKLLHESLHSVMRTVEKQLGIPIPYTVVTQDGTPVLTTAPRDMDSPMATPRRVVLTTNPFSQISIIGVYLTPIPFLTLSDGQRVFEGGKLPGTDYIVEKIYLDMVMLQLNGQRSTHPL